MRLATTWFRSPLLVVLALVGSAGCTKSFASAPRPDLSGVWDVIYDDYFDVEIRIGERVQHMRIGREGGNLLASDSHGSISLDIDCSREELICPHEVWLGEPTLTNRMGDLDDEGENLTVSLAGEGHRPCVLGSDSAVGANVVSLGSARDGNWQASALSNGRVTTVVSGRCLGADGAAAQAQVALSIGMSAVRR